MKSVIASLVAVAGMSVAANAIVNTQVDFLASVDGGPFVPHLEIDLGQGVKRVEIVARFTYVGPGTAVGFASAIFQPTMTGLSASDGIVALTAPTGGNTTTPSGAVSDTPGQYGRINPFARSALSTTSTALFNHVHNGNAGAPAGRTLRIAQRSATSWMGAAGNTTGGQGVTVSQLGGGGRTASDPAFNPSLSVNVFRWGFDIDTGLDGTNEAAERIVTIDAPLNGFGNRVTSASTNFPTSAVGDREVYWWSQAGFPGNSGDLRGTALVAQGFLELVVVPSPASLALLGLGGLCVARRRR